MGIVAAHQLATAGPSPPIAYQHQFDLLAAHLTPFVIIIRYC